MLYTDDVTCNTRIIGNVPIEAVLPILILQSHNALFYCV